MLQCTGIAAAGPLGRFALEGGPQVLAWPLQGVVTHGPRDSLPQLWLRAVEPENFHVEQFPVLLAPLPLATL